MDAPIVPLLALLASPVLAAYVVAPAVSSAVAVLERRRRPADLG